MRSALLATAALVTGLLLAACGGSGDQTASVGGGTITVPGDVHGVYGELESLLAQFPYQRWYTECVVARVKKELGPREAEALEEQAESSDTVKAEKIIAAAGRACEKTSGRPVIDPNATDQELAIYRGGLVEEMRKIAESRGFEGARLECVERTFEELPGGKVVGLGNGTHQVREGILLSVLAQCVKAQ
ncbi:MAG TPA: hypothetical protein VHA76_00020 [Solirubrobacterales bacterium]|nr:hypothetical protein [Solirubrobacterales bacterium]